MWLPTPIYERLPHTLLLVGLLFMSTVMYLGMDHPQTPLYFGAGFFCCLWSLFIFEMRLRNRKREPRQGAPAHESGSGPSGVADDG